MYKFLKNLIRDLIPPEIPEPPKFEVGGFLLNYDDLETEDKANVEETN